MLLGVPDDGPSEPGHGGEELVPGVAAVEGQGAGPDSGLASGSDRGKAGSSSVK